MKATGIVRRIDDLGRVVIPKEIRRTMRIREGDPLEIFTDGGGEVIFKKYSPIGELSTFAADCAEVVSKVTGSPCAICDRDHVIFATGPLKKELTGRRVSSMLEEIMSDRGHFVGNGSSTLVPIEGAEHSALSASTIIASGDICGSVILLAGSQDEVCTEANRFPLRVQSIRRCRQAL